jgi:hypothetical protein
VGTVASTGERHGLSQSAPGELMAVLQAIQKDTREKKKIPAKEKKIPVSNDHKLVSRKKETPASQLCSVVYKKKGGSVVQHVIKHFMKVAGSLWYDCAVEAQLW